MLTDKCDICGLDTPSGELDLTTELLEACKEALPLLERLVPKLRFQSAGNEFWPNREEGEGLLDALTAVIAKAERADDAD